MSVRQYALLVLAALLGGCSFAPELKLPEVPVASAYKEAQPWVPAQPADHLPRGAWWRLYGDAELDALQEKLLAHSPDLAAALARYQQALAYSEQARAGLFPTLSANGQAGRNRVSEHRPLVPPNAVIPPTYSNYSIGLQAN